MSFDLEEFDILLEHKQRIDPEEQFQISQQGLHAVLELLDRLGIRATFFTTATFALRFPEQVRRLAERHEVASHGYSHGKFEEGDELKSKQVLEEITGRSVRGFRRARFAPVDDASLRRAGYAYDSSINPILLPGRYNHLNRPRTVHRVDGLLEIPVSATPLVRFPLFWLTFKNIPLFFIRAATQWTLQQDGYVNLLFHPWEFAELGRYRLPGYIKRPCGGALLNRLEKYLYWLQVRGEFVTMNEFSETHAR